jgi:hypothetical protein
MTGNRQAASVPGRDFSPEPSDQPFQIPPLPDCGAFSLLPFATESKRKRNADRRGSRLRTGRCGACPDLLCLPHLRERFSRGHARLSASHRGSRQGDLRHPGRNSGHASWDVVCRVLPAFACPSPVSTSRADRSIGRHDARAGRGTGRILPPAATAPAPHSRIPSRKASLNERDLAKVTDVGTNVKRLSHV